MRRSLRNPAALWILALVCPGCDIQFQDCNGDGFVTWDEIEATLMGDSCSSSDPSESDGGSQSTPTPNDDFSSPDRSETTSPDASSGA